MANNYIQFSTNLSLPSDEAEQYALNLAKKIRACVCPTRDDIPECFCYDDIEAWNCEVVKDGSGSPGIVVYSEESGNPEAAAIFLQHLVKKYWPTEYTSFAWADTCSKPRIGEFGGGAAFITADRIVFHWTGTWIDEQINRHNGKPGPLIEACKDLITSEDNTGCSDDLTVVSKSAVERIESALKSV